MALCQCSPPWALHGVEGALVYPGQIPELAFECHGYGTHGYGIYRYSIIPSPHPRHHPGEFAGAGKSTTSMFCVHGYGPRANTKVRFPRPPQTPPWSPHLNMHGWAGAGHCSPAVLQTPTASRGCLFIFSSASATEVLRTYGASWSQWVRKGQRGEGVRGKQSKQSASLGKMS